MKNFEYISVLKQLKHYQKSTLLAVLTLGLCACDPLSASIPGSGGTGPLLASADVTYTPVLPINDQLTTPELDQKDQATADNPVKNGSTYIELVVSNNTNASSTCAGFSRSISLVDTTNNNANNTTDKNLTNQLVEKLQLKKDNNVVIAVNIENTMDKVGYETADSCMLLSLTNASGHEYLLANQKCTSEQKTYQYQPKAKFNYQVTIENAYELFKTGNYQLTYLADIKDINNNNKAQCQLSLSLTATKN